MAPQLLPDLGGLRLCPTGVDYTDEDKQKGRAFIEEYRKGLRELQREYWIAAAKNLRVEILDAYFKIRSYLDIETHLGVKKGVDLVLLEELDPYFKKDFDFRLQNALLFKLYPSPDPIAHPVALTPAAVAIKWKGGLANAVLCRTLAGNGWALAGKPIKEAFYEYSTKHMDSDWMGDEDSTQYSIWLHLRNLIVQTRAAEDEHYSRHPEKAPDWWKACIADMENAPAWWKYLVV